MPPKIERIWGSIFGQTAIRRRDAAEHENPHARQQNQDGGANTGSGRRNPYALVEQEKPISRPALEKAVDELRASEHFVQTGVKVEISGPDGALTVQFSLPNGDVIKTVTAADFMKQTSGSTDEAPRGKILDQKL